MAMFASTGSGVYVVISFNEPESLGIAVLTKLTCLGVKMKELQQHTTVINAA